MPGSKIGTSARIKGMTTNRVRRHDAVYSNDRMFAPTALQPAPPPPPATPPRPLGELGTMSPEEVAGLAGEWFPGGSANRAKNRNGMMWLLNRLAEFPGETWHQRWEAGGFNEPGAHAGARFANTDYQRYQFISAVGHAFAMRLIQPTLRAFRSYKFARYSEWFRRVADDPLLEEFCTRTNQLKISRNTQRRAHLDVCGALTVFGIALADLTPEALLHFAVESRAYGLARSGRASDGCFAATQAWPVLYDMGHFPPSAPRTLRAAVTKGQRSIAELVDRHQLRNHAIRDLLIDYITRRSATLDYSSVSGLVNLLVRAFWKQIETINPKQADLRLDEYTFRKWKEWLLVLPNGQPRKDVDAPLLAVRGLYLDLHTWSAEDPARWSRWVAPCPIRDEDLRWFQIRRRRINERMANRTRDRQPLLPILSGYVNDHWHHIRDLLTATRAVGLGEQFTFAGTNYQRTASSQDRKGWDPAYAPLRAVNRDTGELVHLTRQEAQAFWGWATIETLRLAGLRVEELTELTHLSVRNYQRPNGEVVALLVIAPSKSDRERVIPMSGELFHVIAQIIRRHITEHGTVPIATRYDTHDKIWAEPLPYLFQTVHSAGHRAMSPYTVWRHIARASETLAQTRPEFEGVKFAPHDFRRLFATELVNNGLPIHIGAALLGHVNIQTTRGYVAVFDDNVIAHYQQFLDRRRAQRPEDEYHVTTTSEWQEFQEHFDKRRVELGSCGRPYGTGCTHEHACIRCPMLSINPKMLPRLDELEEDLINRRQRAVNEGWKGEIEGLDLTLTFLRSKRAQAQRNARLGTPAQVNLGMPEIPTKRRHDDHKITTHAEPL